MAKFSTENDARQAIINKALEYLGAHEGDERHKFIVDSYNSVKPLPRGYQVKYTDAWCATFVTFVFDSCDMTNLIERECGCQEMINKCKGRNLIDFQKLSSNMVEGNVVFYDWDNNGRSDHVGIIYKVTGTQIYVIEGNYSDEVRIRNIDRTSKQISCVLTPYYDTTVLKPDDQYAKLGWNKDNNGWWYQYGIDINEYFKNTATYLNGALYFFDEQGYICDGRSSIANKDGAIIQVKGERTL